MIEAIRAIALSCGEDIVQDLRDLADELEAKKIKPATKKPKKATPKTAPRVTKKTKEVVEVKPSKNKWNPRDYTSEVPKEKQPLTPINPRVRRKVNMVEAKCSIPGCKSKMKISEQLLAQSEVSGKPFRCDKCIAKGL